MLNPGTPGLEMPGAEEANGANREIIFPDTEERVETPEALIMPNTAQLGNRAETKPVAPEVQPIETEVKPTESMAAVPERTNTGGSGIDINTLEKVPGSVAEASADNQMIGIEDKSNLV